MREDLFYRLNVARIEIPALKDRGSDALLLLKYFMNSLSESLHCPLPELDEKTTRLLQGYSWPGNVRELKNVAQQLLLNLPLDLPGGKDAAAEQHGIAQGLDRRVELFEQQLICEALERNQGRVIKTAEELQIPRKKLTCA